MEVDGKSLLVLRLGQWLMAENRGWTIERGDSP